jgi:DNA (cytosine-5)-methyltransferase 1
MLTSLSLYTGAGGLDLGLHAAGFTPRVAVEFDPIAVATLRHEKNARWWADCAIESKPIVEVTSTQLLRAAQLKQGDADLLAGGPPCQPFSKSGYWHSGDSKRLNDPRADTIGDFLRVVEDTLPRAFLLENVPGLAFSEKDEGLELIRKKVERINRKAGTDYQICAAQLNAVEFGVPQMRERVFVIAHREGRKFVFPQPTHAKPPRVDMARGTAALPDDYVVPSGLKPFTTAWDAIGHLGGKDEPELKPRGQWAPLLPSIPEGHNYLYHTERGDGEEIFGWRTRYWSMLLKLAKNRPSWTLTAQPGPAIGPFHWKSRRLSAKELCALQTFPKKYKIVGSVLAAHKQVGNAVPSALAEILGREIRIQLLDDKVHGTPTLVPRHKRATPTEEEVPRAPKQFWGRGRRLAPHPGTGRGPGAKLNGRRRKHTAGST